MIKLSEIKNWSVGIETEITEEWKTSEMFSFNENTKKPIYSIDTPPPYINLPIHIGQATTYALMDMFARYRRMKGYEVLFPLGLDRNGLPIEIAAEKRFNISAFKVNREEFITKCEQMLQETSTETMDSFARLGISFTSYKHGSHLGSVYLTDSPEYRALTQATFIELYKKGMIYENTMVSNWDPKLRTTVADSEIEYVDLKSLFVHVQWKVKETNEIITIATTRPELIATCAMVIYNPEDERYKHLEGKTAVTPIFGKEVKIIAHPFAQIEKGTGIVMMCSAGDLTDIRFFREMKLDVVIAIEKDGTMNDSAGFLKGLKVRDARQKMIEELKEKGLVIKEEEIMHRTPISERSKAEIEFIAMPELYLRQLDIKEKLLKLQKHMNFYPEDARHILENWIEQISIDWPISRRRFYSTEVPLWYSGDAVAIPKPGKYIRPWKDAPPPDADVMKHGKVISKVSDMKDAKWIGETRVLDTWFDSSISELFISGYKSNEKLFKAAYPVSLRPQGKEIVRTWLYYTVLRGYIETGKLCFDDIWVNQHVVDANGVKMSKSLGNVINPHDILKEFGAEAFRLWTASEGDISRQDISFTKEKVNGEQKTINKLLNASRFVWLFPSPSTEPVLTELDKLFIDCVEDLTAQADKYYDVYDFYHPSLRLKGFLWNEFASNYLEMVKERAYNNKKHFSPREQESAHFTLHYLMKRLILLLYPVIPQVCSVLGAEYGIQMHTAEFPNPKKASTDFSKLEKLMVFNSTIWKAKKDRKLSLNSHISGIKVPEDLREFEKDLVACHHLV